MRILLYMVISMVLYRASSFKLMTKGSCLLHLPSRLLSGIGGGHRDSAEKPFVITSSTNSKVQLFKSLQQKRKRDSLGLIVLEGGRMIQDALKEQYLPHLVLMTADAYHESNIGRDIRHSVESLATSSEFTAKQSRFVPYEPHKSSKTILTELKDDLQEESVVYPGDGMVHVVSDSVYKSISETANGQGIIATFAKKVIDKTSLQEDIRKRGSALILLLDGIQDPGNVGSLIRSAYGLGVNLVVSINSCDVFNSKVVRSSMGTVLSLPVVECGYGEAKECLKDLHDMIGAAGYQTVIADGSSADGGKSVSYDTVSYTKRDTVLVIGSEAHGVSREATDMLHQINRDISGAKGWDAAAKGEVVRVCIPMSRGLESFNAAVAGSILLAEIQRQCKTT